MLIGSSLDIFDEYTRRQYLAKAPQRNPFGEEEEPLNFAEFDIFTKLKVLHQLTVWTLNNPDRIKERLEEKDETSWVSCFSAATASSKLTLFGSESSPLVGIAMDERTSS